MYQFLAVGSMLQGLAECHTFQSVCESWSISYGQTMMENGCRFQGGWFMG